MTKNPFRTLYLARKSDEAEARPFADLFDAVVLGEKHFLDYITPCDTILFGGGTDVNPSLYGETPHPLTDTPDMHRDHHERMLFRRAQAAGAACIGICRGAQLLCALSGGKLIQHVSGHKNTHHVLFTKEGNAFAAAADHHQMMYPYDTLHQLIAWGPGLGESHCEYGKTYEGSKEPEIVWFPDTRSLSIQPHPEWMEKESSFSTYCRELVKQYIFVSTKQTVTH